MNARTAQGRDFVAHASWPPPSRKTLKASSVSVVVAILSTLVACSDKPSDVVMPMTVGVVEEIEVRSGAGAVAHLRSGEDVELSAAEPLLGGSPVVEELLVAGKRNDEGWYFAIPAQSRRCPFLIGGTGGAWEEQDSFVFGFGLRLQKATDFEPLSVHRDPDVPVDVLLCVNEQGEVIGEAR